MGTCERCGRRLTKRGQKRFCSERCAGFRPMPTEKRCNKCGYTLPVGRFRIKAGRPYSWCRACEASHAAATTLRDVAAARARKAASERKRRADPVIGAKLRKERRHYHRFRGSTPDERDYAAILKRDPCSYCNGAAGEVDHIDPTTSGGPDHWSNLTAACRSCNAQKNDRTLLLWIGERIVAYEEERLAA